MSFLFLKWLLKKVGLRFVSWSMRRLHSSKCVLLTNRSCLGTSEMCSSLRPFSFEPTSCARLHVSLEIVLLIMFDLHSFRHFIAAEIGFLLFSASISSGFRSCCLSMVSTISLATCLENQCAVFPFVCASLMLLLSVRAFLRCDIFIIIR